MAPSGCHATEQTPCPLSLRLGRLGALGMVADEEQHGGLVANAFGVVRDRGVPQTRTFYDYVTIDWARKWPSEDLWVAHRR